MKDPKFSFVAVAGDREDGAPADYARYGSEDRDRLAETDIMLALTPDERELWVSAELAGTAVGTPWKSLWPDGLTGGFQG